MLQWPVGLANAFQALLTEPNVTDPNVLVNQFRIKPELLSWPFLDVYFPLQPGLLTAIVIVGFVIVGLLIALVGLALALFLGNIGDQLYDVTKDRKNNSKFTTTMLSIAFIWLLLMGCTALIISYLMNLSNNQLSLASDSPVTIKEDNKSADQFVTMSLNSITVVNRKWKQSTRFGETDVLNKYNDIREKGYEFRALETNSDYDLQTVSLGLVVFFYCVALFTLALVMGVGTREHYRSYHPMERSTSSNWCGRVAQVLSGCLLAVTPLTLTISALLMTYSHVHNVVCPIVQNVLQNQDIEDYVNSKFVYFDPYNLLDFLNDLAVERADLNQLNCEGFVKPLQGIWITLTTMTLLSMLMSLSLWRLSTHLLKVRSKIYLSQKETFGTLKKKPINFDPVLPAPRY